MQVTTGGYFNLAGDPVPGAHDPVSRYRMRRRRRERDPGEPHGRTDIGAVVRAMVSLDLRFRPDPEIEACAVGALARDGDISKAIACFARYRAWRDRVRLNPIVVEEPLVSEQWQFGGTPDLIARINGRDALVGFSPALQPWTDHLVTLSAHSLLWEEHNPDEPVEDCHLVGLPIDGAGFSAHAWRAADLEPHGRLFRNWLDGLRLEQECEQAMREGVLAIDDDG